MDERERQREPILPGLLWLVRADFRIADWGSGKEYTPVDLGQEHWEGIKRPKMNGSQEVRNLLILAFII